VVVVGRIAAPVVEILDAAELGHLGHVTRLEQTGRQLPCPDEVS
jgi:hypothetical protein